MRHRAIRPLHVLACAPVVALVAAAFAPSWHARADSGPPQPYVIAIDAGHGGSPDNAHPDQLFDPGAVGQNGLMEKDLTLEVARRVRDLLQQDDVKVVLTRDRDVYMDIGPRMQAALDAHAQLFVSIHFNSFQDASVNGTVVLYPNDNSKAFAGVMSAALAHRLSPFGISDDGVILRDNLWVHATMPAVTIEPAYLSNTTEAALLARDDVRAAIAAGVVDGIERQDPTILRRKAEIVAWQSSRLFPFSAAHPAPATGRSAGGLPVLPLLGLAAVAMALAALRRPIVAVPRAVVARIAAAPGAALGALRARPRAPSRRRALSAASLPAPVVGTWSGPRLSRRPPALRNARSHRRPAAAGPALRSLGGVVVRLAYAVAEALDVHPTAAVERMRFDLPRPGARISETGRRRRRTARRRALIERARQTTTRPTVYDELWY